MPSVLWTPTPTAPQTNPNATIVSDARLTNYLAASAVAILIADYFATVDQETTHTIFFQLWNRYSTIITVMSCATFMFKEIKSNKTEGLVSTLLVASFDLMLTMRVWILYGKTHRMAWILFPMLVAELALMLVILLLPATYLDDFVHLGPVLPGCYFTVPAMRGPYFAFYALPPLLVTFAMFILTVYKCIKTLRRNKNVEMPIVTLFLRDGIIWFIVVFGVDGVQMLVWATGRATLTQVLIIPCLVLYSLVSSRVLLNTKSLSQPIV
ncbi:hypothetical protein C8R43DRAFT_1126881 [Mycena crocata]|nr:hypothetical protein C8R43DRAFT_1126881 [Mycena crocata]